MKRTIKIKIDPRTGHFTASRNFEGFNGARIVLNHIAEHPYRMRLTRRAKLKNRLSKMGQAVKIFYIRLKVAFSASTEEIISFSKRHQYEGN
jgi:hypothetical protein